MKPKNWPPGVEYLVGGMFKTYEDYLLSYIWQEKRENMLSTYPHCYFCKLKATEVHHKTYKRVTCEKSKDMLTICRGCHQKIHNGNN